MSSTGRTLRVGTRSTLELRPNLLFISDRLKVNRRYYGLGAAEAIEVPQSIPYYNVLWAEVFQDCQEIAIDFAEPNGANRLTAAKVSFTLTEESGLAASITEWVETLLDRAYGNATRRKRALVLLNPKSGPGDAEKIWQDIARPLFQAARMHFTVIRTKYSGQAIDLAENLNVDDYDLAVACSGDGLPHEIFNGLAKRPDARRALSEIAVCQLPAGSGNAMSCNLYGTHHPGPAALAIIKGVPTPIDLVSITQSDRRTISFLSQAIGLIADLDLTTEHLRWMGDRRFTYGFFMLALKKMQYPCDIAVKMAIEDKMDIKAWYRDKRQNSGLESEEVLAQLEGGRQDSLGIKEPWQALQERGHKNGLPPLNYGTVNDEVPEDWEKRTCKSMGSLYCGNMPLMAPGLNFFPASLAADGYIDFETVPGDISLFKKIAMQLEVENNQFFENPLLEYRKVLAYRVTPHAKEGYISIDGERVPFEPFQAEVHQKLGLTLSKLGKYDAPGPMSWERATARRE